MERTYKEWFELIEDETIRKQALVNLVKYPRIPDDGLSRSVNEALSGGFDWPKTPQRYVYWKKIQGSEIKLRELPREEKQFDEANDGFANHAQKFMKAFLPELSDNTVEAGKHDIKQEWNNDEAIQQAIQLLKSAGYKVLKPTTNYEEI